MAGLAPANLRLLPAANDAPDIVVEIEGADDAPQVSADGAILRIEHGDGSVTVALDGKPLGAPRKAAATAWFANLADEGRIDDMELGRIAEELLRGVSDDNTSRREWIEARATGIQLLGLKIEVPGLQGASDGAPVEGMSRVRHSGLLEAVLRFQANARSELLPTDGPVKVRNDAQGGVAAAGGAPAGGAQGGQTPQQDGLADALETDLNHYLTAVATEYYPDTDRMLLKLGFAGTAFKKVYFCPLRMRPVSETVDADDLIVSNEATDLANAKRVTHRLMMRPSTVKRMQILGVYRDVSLSTPLAPEPDSAKREEQAQQGVSPDAMNPADRDRELYECYCELEIKGFEHTWRGAPSGLELPYRVTIDVSSREILSIVRNYDAPLSPQGADNQLPEARTTFVKYTFVPGLGFYDIGLLHILGNTTNALTAALRLMLDNGMFANFPGFLISKQGSRQNTSIIRVPPGGGQQIDTGGQSIGDAVMPLPYNTQQMPALMALVQALEQDLQRLGGVSEMQVGEGRPDAPVGTTLAMIEQATKILNSVHKRMHAAQAEEFRLLVECFREHPESFWERGCASPTRWTAQTFLQALDNCDLTPQADPNTSSHGERVLKVQALNMWAAANPTLADPVAIAKTTLTAMGWSNPEQFMAPPSAMAAPPPELQQMQAGMKAQLQEADARTTEANAKAAMAQAKVAEVRARAQEGLGAAQTAEPSPLEAMTAKAAQATAKAKLMDAQTDRAQLGLKAHELAADTANQAADRESRERLAVLDLERDVLSHPAQAAEGAAEAGRVEREVGTGGQ